MKLTETKFIWLELTKEIQDRFVQCHQQAILQVFAGNMKTMFSRSEINIRERQRERGSALEGPSEVAETNLKRLNNMNW